MCPHNRNTEPSCLGHVPQRLAMQCTPSSVWVHATGRLVDEYDGGPTHQRACKAQLASLPAAQLARSPLLAPRQTHSRHSMRHHLQAQQCNIAVELYSKHVLLTTRRTKSRHSVSLKYLLDFQSKYYAHMHTHMTSHSASSALPHVANRSNMAYHHHHLYTSSSGPPVGCMSTLFKQHLNTHKQQHGICIPYFTRVPLTLQYVGVGTSKQASKQASKRVRE